MNLLASVYDNSNIVAIIGYRLSYKYGISAFIIDLPVVFDFDFIHDWMSSVSEFN